VLLWAGGGALLNPACDPAELWSGRVPVEINDLRDIFGDVLVLGVETEADLWRLPRRLRVLMYSSNTHSLALVQAAVAAARPRVVVQLSDEWRRRPDHLHLDAPCVIRQYRRSTWAWPDHVLQLPPFAHCWDGPPLPPLPFGQRSLQWCFVGNPKGDRERLCGLLARALPACFAGQSHPSENAPRYQRSLLTLNPRGDASLETSRPYSALRCGCVPVGIGQRWEVQECLGRLRPRCPLLDLYAEDEAGLLALASALVSDEQRWQRASAALLQWDAACRAELRAAVAAAAEIPPGS
jgi:hypothetical protein